jgi:DNA-binding transcriptional regulator YdaS (Cro superfamily)
MKKKQPVVMPCPYCADPALLDAPKGKGGPAIPVSPADWRIWRGQVPLLGARAYSVRFVADVPAKHLAEKFAGFSARLVGVNVGRGFNSTAAPPMFDYQILGAIDSIVEGLNLFSAWAVEGRGVETRAHWWPTHETIINQRVTLAAKDAAGRNAQLEHACAALDFFAVERRGQGKITEAAVRNAVKRIGPSATQVQAAKALGVSESAIEKWRQRRRISSWGEVVKTFSAMPQ